MAFCVVIAICSAVSDSQKEKEKKTKNKAIADEVRRTFEVQKRTEQLREERLQAQHREGAEEFRQELEKIPVVEISVADSAQDLTNCADFPSDSLTTLKPRNGVRKSLYTDFTVIDVETTGLSEYDDIIEISAIKYKNLTPVSAFTSLIKPPGTIPAKITALTHIDDDMVANAPSINQIMPAFIAYIGDDNILAHNISFDLKFLYRAGFDCFTVKRRYYDTLQIARAKLTKEDVENHKLETLCNHYKIYRNDAHRSLSDCFATAKIYEKLLYEYDFK